MGFAPRQLFLLLVFAYVYVLHIFSLFLSLLRMGNSFAWKRWKRDTAVSRKREFYKSQRWDSLRDIIPLALLSLCSSYTSLIFIISLSLSRRGCKQPFHRLFGRLAFVVVYGIVCKPTSNPFESLINKKRETQTASVRISLFWRKA